MGIKRRRFHLRFRRILWLLCAASVALPRLIAAQGLTGALVGTVKDAQGGVLPGAAVRVSSPALIGGPARLTTNEKGQLRFPALPPGPYALDIELQGFSTYHEADIGIGAGVTIERTAVLTVAALAETIVVEGGGSRLEARGSGFGTRFGTGDISAIPTRRSGMFDLIGAAPGISATSKGTGANALVSAFGSAANENAFLIDGTNFTSPVNGVARAEPGIDFIQEIQVQSVGASAEYGNVQGAVVNIVTRQGGNTFMYDASYSAQPASLTSQPVRLAIPGAGQQTSGYERARYHDATTELGGPVVRERLWFVAGYEYLRDYDSQPGTMTYDGLVTVVEKRRSNGWQAFGSYTLSSRASGLQAYSGTTAAGPQVSTVGAPPGSFSPPVTFGRDPNDLTNANGRLPTDRPHMFRVMGSADVAHTGFVFAANLEVSSGKPWAATGLVSLPQNTQQRILLEPRGSRRLSTQSLLDLRVSRTVGLGALGRIELLVDVLNALNNTAEEGLATDNLFSPSLAQPTQFVDPRRVMVGARINLHR